MVADRPLPAKLPDDWTKDTHWSAAAERSPYRHVIDPQIWLPADFDDVFVADSVPGAPVAFGSSLRLIEQLRAMNEQTLNGSKDDLVAWRRAGPEESLESVARFGLGVFIELADRSVESRLPMILDY